MSIIEDLNIISDLLLKFSDSPRLIPFIDLSVKISHEGFETALAEYSIYLSKYTETFNKIKYLLDTHIFEKDIYKVIDLMDKIIPDPGIRIKLLKHFEDKYGYDAFSRLIRDKSKYKKVLSNIKTYKKLFGFLDTLYFMEINCQKCLAYFLKIPVKSLVIPEETMERVKLMAEIISRNNNLILAGDDFIGKSTHLYLLAFVLMKKYSYRLVYSSEHERLPKNTIAIYDDIDYHKVNSLLAKRFIGTMDKHNLDIVKKFYKSNNYIVISPEELKKTRNYTGQTIIVKYDQSIYCEKELKQIAVTKGLNNYNDLMEIHIEEYCRKNNIKELPSNINDLIYSVFTKYYEEKKYSPLIGLVSVYTALHNISLKDIILSVTKMIKTRGDPFSLLAPLSNKVYMLPHKVWAKTINTLLEENDDFKKIFEAITNWTNILANIEKYLYTTASSIEELLIILNYPQLLEKTLRRKHVNPLIKVIYPIHYIDLGTNTYITELRDKISRKGLTSKAMFKISLLFTDIHDPEMILNMLRNKGLQGDPKKKVEKLFSLRKAPLGAVIEAYEKEKDPYVKNIIERILYDRISLNKDTIEYYEQLRRLGSKKLLSKLYVLFGHYDKALSLLETSQKRLGLKKYVFLKLLSGRPLKKKLSSKNVYSTYMKAIIFSRLGILDEAKNYLTKTYVESLNNVKTGEFEQIDLLFNSGLKLLKIYLLEKDDENVKAFLTEYLSLLNTYGFLLDSWKYEKIDKFLKTLNNYYSDGKCISDPDLCCLLAYLLDDQKVFMDNYEKLREEALSTNELKDIIMLLKYIRIGLKKDWLINLDEVEQILRLVEKYINVPKIKYRYLSIIPVIIMKYASKPYENINEKYLSIDNAFHDLANHYGFWALYLYLKYLYARMVYYTKKGLLSKALIDANKALNLLNDLKLLPPRYSERLRKHIVFWKTIIQIMMKNYENCRKVFEKELMEDMRVEKNYLIRYWYYKCLLGEKLYRTVIIESDDILIRRTVDPVIKLNYYVLRYIASRGTSSYTEQLFLKDLMEHAKNTISKDPGRISDVLEVICRLIRFLAKEKDVKALRIIGVCLTDALKSIDPNDLISGNIIFLLKNFMRLYFGIGFTDIVYEIGNVLSKIYFDWDIFELYIESLIKNGLYTEAYNYLYRNIPRIKPEYREAYEAIIMFHRGDMEKSARKAEKVFAKIDKDDLAIKLAFIIGKYYEKNGRLKRAINYYRKILSHSPKSMFFEKPLLGDIYLRLAEYNMMHSDFEEAYKCFLDALRLYEDLVFIRNRLEYIVEIPKILDNLLYCAQSIKDPFTYRNAKELVCDFINKYIKIINKYNFTYLFTPIINMCSSRKF
ncbi:MAG: hypothetical protein J7J82_03425 [Staphylothermus sp.]|nr:hypothetical protein [Staphylothermus sp.]